METRDALAKLDEETRDNIAKASMDAGIQC